MLSVGQCVVKHHTNVYRMVIVGYGSTVHRDMMKILMSLL